jgi:hypothetical protein
VNPAIGFGIHFLFGLAIPLPRLLAIVPRHRTRTSLLCAVFGILLISLTAFIEQSLDLFGRKTSHLHGDDSVRNFADLHSPFQDASAYQAIISSSRALDGSPDVITCADEARAYGYVDFKGLRCSDWASTSCANTESRWLGNVYVDSYSILQVCAGRGLV